MKKIKFLSGMGAMFAFAVVALAAIFTSCEKEDFKVNVTPVNAKAVINPIVLVVENGVTTDVTSSATISGTTEFEGNPDLAQTTSVLTVSYKDLSTEVTVVVPALKAGQIATLTPTVVLQQEYDIVAVTSAETSESTKSVELKNEGDYWYFAKVKYTEKKGVKVGEPVFYTNDVLKKQSIEELLSAIADTYTETEKVVLPEDEVVPVYAHSKTIVKVTYIIVTTKYEIKEVAKTKADGEVLAEMVTEEYTTTTLDASENNLQIEGHGHAPAGHGHGHGHGSGEYDNAGGGIINAD